MQKNASYLLIVIFLITYNISGMQTRSCNNTKQEIAWPESIINYSFVIKSMYNDTSNNILLPVKSFLSQNTLEQIKKYLIYYQKNSSFEELYDFIDKEICSTDQLLNLLYASDFLGIDVLIEVLIPLVAKYCNKQTLLSINTSQDIKDQIASELRNYKKKLFAQKPEILQLADDNLITALNISSNNYVITGHANGRIKIWCMNTDNIKPHKQIDETSYEQVSNLPFNFDDDNIVQKHFKICSSYYKKQDEKKITHTSSIKKISFNKQHTLMATFAKDGVALIWSLPEGEYVCSFGSMKHGHTYALDAAQFHGDKFFTMSPDNDDITKKIVKVWIIKDKRPENVLTITTPGMDKNLLVNNDYIWRTALKNFAYDSIVKHRLSKEQKCEYVFVDKRIETIGKPVLVSESGKYVTYPHVKPKTTLQLLMQQKNALVKIHALQNIRASLFLQHKNQDYLLVAQNHNNNVLLKKYRLQNAVLKQVSQCIFTACNQDYPIKLFASSDQSLIAFHNYSNSINVLKNTPNTLKYLNNLSIYTNQSLRNIMFSTKNELAATAGKMLYMWKINKNQNFVDTIKKLKSIK